MLPKRRDTELLIEELPTETLLYDTTDHKVRCLNSLARLVWKHCDGRTKEAEMVEIIRKELNIAVDASVVRLTLEKLAQAGLLETEESSWFATPTSRRQATKTLAKCGIVAAATLVATIVAPTPAMAVSIGAACAMNGDCVSNNCCKSTPAATPCGVCFPAPTSCNMPPNFNGNC
jgi:hypothetical protein